MSSGKSSGGCLKWLFYFIVLIAVVGYIGNKIDSNNAEDDYRPSGNSTSVSDIGGNGGNVTFPSVNDSQIQAAVSAELKNVPEVLRENVYLDYIGGGYCEKFSGNIEINVVFVTDDESKWNSSAQSTAKTEIDAQRIRISEAASSAGVSLALSVRYHEAILTGQSVNGDNVQSNWRDSAIRSAGLGDLLTAQTGIESARGVSSAPIVFLFNQSGRATASHQVTGRAGAETVILFSSGISSLFHELCHLYGARDFYYPSDVEALADKYLSDSIMNSGDTVDPLTAFIIGWTDTLSPSAESFLRETSYVTNEYLHEEHGDETFTGYGTREYGGGTYTGNMVNGWPHGQGTLKNSSGSYYSGTWDNGDFLHGECVIHYTDGAVFRGNKVNGVINGYGEMTYSDGDVYKGNWKDGNRDGYGTYIYNNGTKEEGYYSNNKGNGQCVIYYADGAVFRGNKVNGVISGYGEITYSDGGWYKGNYKDGKRNGYGEMKYSDGAVYQGNWVDGNRHGQGTLYYASGAVYSGNWLDNTANGYGAMTYANGNYYSGNWENGLPNGYGEMKYTNGDVYKGNWKDNTRHGHGTYRWASGSVKSGNWSNGEYVG